MSNKLWTHISDKHYAIRSLSSNHGVICIIFKNHEPLDHQTFVDVHISILYCILEKHGMIPPQWWSCKTKLNWSIWCNGVQQAWKSYLNHKNATYRLAQGGQKFQNSFFSHTNKRTGSSSGRQSVLLTPSSHWYDRGMQHHCCTRQGCTKLAGNKTVSQQCTRGRDPVNYSNKLNHKARQEKAKMTKWTTNIMIAVAAVI